MAEMSPLRRRMIEDMTVRNLSPATQQSYVYAVAKFSRYFGRSPDRLGLEEVRAYQIHLVAPGCRGRTQPGRRALRFFFGVTLGRQRCRSASRHAREPRKLPVVLSAEEIVALPGGGPRAAQPSGADHGLWCRAAGVGGRRPQDRRHRQRPHADPGRARQGRQGPLRHALAAAADHPAHLLASGAAAPLAVPRA